MLIRHRLYFVTLTLISMSNIVLLCISYKHLSSQRMSPADFPGLAIPAIELLLFLLMLTN